LQPFLLVGVLERDLRSLGSTAFHDSEERSSAFTLIFLQLKNRPPQEGAAMHHHYGHANRQNPNEKSQEAG